MTLLLRPKSGGGIVAFDALTALSCFAQVFAWIVFNLLTWFFYANLNGKLPLCSLRTSQPSSTGLGSDL